MKNINRKLLTECLRQLSDRDFQVRAWSGAMPGVVSSFVETVCMAFDDTGLASATPQERNAELGERASNLVQELDDALKQVNGRLSVPELVNSNAMERVRELSRKLVDLLDQS